MTKGTGESAEQVFRDTRLQTRRRCQDSDPAPTVHREHQEKSPESWFYRIVVQAKLLNILPNSGGSAARGWAGLFPTPWLSDNLARMATPRLGPTYVHLVQQPVRSDGIETPTEFAIVSFGALLSAEIGTEKRLRRSALRMRTLESGAA